MARSMVGDGSIGSPSLHIRSWISASPFAPHLRPLRGKNAGHRARFPKLLCQSLAVAARKGRGVMLRRHPDIQPQTKSEGGLGHIEARPAPILFKSAGALLALWYVLKRTAKVAIMKKMILAINPKA